MPWTNNPKIDALRSTYNAAFDAHREATRLLRETSLLGERATAMIEKELSARSALNDARAALLAEMSKVIVGADDPEAPTSR
jgi:hypothetical protein